jgi:hypothetical protein
VSHQEHYQEENELPFEYVEEEQFDETHLVGDLIHEEAPHEDESLIFSPPLDEVIQASIFPAQEEKKRGKLHSFSSFRC